MKLIQSLPRLLLVGLILMAVAMLGTSMTPVSVSAEGGGSADPPIGPPTYDSIPETGGEAAADSSSDFSGESDENTTPIDGGLLSELMLLVYLL